MYCSDICILSFCDLCKSAEVWLQLNMFLPVIMLLIGCIEIHGKQNCIDHTPQATWYMVIAHQHMWQTACGVGNVLHIVY